MSTKPASVDTFDGDRIEFADGAAIVLSELDQRTREAVFRAFVEAPDRARLYALRDCVRGLYARAVRNDHSIARLAAELELALKGRRLTGRELVYILAAPRMLEREHAAEQRTARQIKGRATRTANAQAESTRRKRQWLKLRAAVSREREWASLSERRWNGEADRRLADWLTERGTPTKASTIANQRTREGWRNGG